jgi:hypothetical protein
MSLFEDIEEMAKDEASIFTYQLVDGSYIMAEEVDYNFDQNVIYITKAELLPIQSHVSS